MRDVIEHLAKPQSALERMHSLLDRNGFLYVFFPPWHGPYAGHQHNAHNFVRLASYLHVIRPTLFLKLLKRGGYSEDGVADEQEIVKNRLTMRKFERIAQNSGWVIKYSKTYFLRPVFLRMGFPKVPNGWIGRLPWRSECFTTG